MELLRKISSKFMCIGSNPLKNAEVVYLVQLPEGIIFTAGLTHTPVPGSENVAWSDIGHVVRVVVALESTPLIDSVCRELVRVYSINVRT